jgi:hypothetical protein
MEATVEPITVAFVVTPHNVKLAPRVEQIDGTKCYMTVFLSSETYGNDAIMLVFNRWIRSGKHSGGWATICHTEADLRGQRANCNRVAAPACDGKFETSVACFDL